MRLIEELLNKARIGLEIKIVLNSATFAGKIIGVTTESIQLDDGEIQSNIKLESIVAYAFLETSDTEKANILKKRNVVNVFNEEISQYWMMLEECEKPKVIAYSDFKKEILERKNYASRFGQIFSIIDYAYKVNEISNNSDRIRKAYALINNLECDYRDDTNIYRLKGILLFMLNKNEEAANSFAMANDYYNALAVTNEKNKRIEYASKLLLQMNFEVYAIKILLEEFAGILCFKQILNVLHNFKEKGAKEFFIFAVIAWKKYKGENFEFKWPDNTVFLSIPNLKYLKEVYSITDTNITVPRINPIEKKGFTKPRDNVDVTYVPIVYTGSIKLFIDSKQVGFITNHNVPPNIHNGDIFFYLGQVNDDELRRRIYDMSAKDLIVNFVLGTSPRNQKLSADNIQLVAGKYEKIDWDNKYIKEGNIIEYDKFERYGKILHNSNELSFRLKNVSDPFLKAFLITTVEPLDCKVRFSIAKRTDGKQYASYVVSLEEFTGEMVREWQQNKLLTESDLEKREEQLKRVMIDSPLPKHLGSYHALNPYLDAENNVQKVEMVSESDSKINDTMTILKMVEEATALYTIKSASNMQLEQAVKIFTCVLENDDVLYANKKLDTAVFGLANIYLRQAQYQKAIDVLEEHLYDERISKEKILNVLIQVYDKSKKSPEVLISLYKEVIQLSQKQNSRMHYMLRLATLEQREKMYEDAVDSFELWMQSRKNMGELGKAPALENSIRQNLAICYYVIGKEQKAKALAEILLKYNSANEIASRILNNAIQVNDAELLITLPNSNDGELFPMIEYGDNIIISDDIKEFISHCMELLDLGSSIKRDIKDGQFIGTLKAAKSIVEQQLNIQRQTSHSRYNNLMIAAKLIMQVCDSGKYESSDLEELRITRQDAYQYAGRAVASMGDTLAEDLDAPEDSILYMYYIALNLLRNPDSKEGAEQDWVNSFVRYLKLYFCTRSDFKSYVRNQNVSSTKDRLSTAVLTEGTATYSINELVVGFMWLMKSIKKSSWAEKLNVAIFESRLAESFFTFFKSVGMSFDGNSLEQFKKLFNEVLTRMDDYAEHLETSLNNCIMNIFANLRYEESVANLQKLCEVVFINRTDKERLCSILEILKALIVFNNRLDFERRSDVLVDALSKLEKMCKSIEEYPTHFSYHVYLQRLYRLRDAISNKRSELYAQYKPSLELEQTDKTAYKDDVGKIRVQFSIKNQQGHQTADNVKVSICESNNLYLCNTEDYAVNIKGIRGGSTEEAILTVGLKNEFLEMPVCDVEILVTYEYNNENAETIKESMESHVFTLNLYNKKEFVRIPNPYAGKTESVMKSDDLFYGRTELIERLVNSIQGLDGHFNYGHAIALYGQTRAGKSSILYHCKKAIKKKYHDRVILADFGSMGSTGSENTIYYKLIDEIYNEILDNHKDMQKNTKYDEWVSFTNQVLLEPQKATDCIIPFLGRLSRMIHSLDEEKIIVLLIDEFTYLHKWINEGTLSKDFMKFWKGIMQDYGFFAILVGQDNMPIFKAEYQNEFASMELEQVTYLGEEYAKQLMYEPIPYNGESRYRSESLERLYELTAGSAFLILKLCDALVVYLNETTSAFITRALVDEFLRKRVLPQKGQKGCVDRATFEAQIQDRSIPGIEDDNIKILLAIARLSRITGQAEISRINCRNLNEEQEKVFNRLVERYVIEKIENRYCKIVVSLLKEWLLYTYGEEG